MGRKHPTSTNTETTTNDQTKTKQKQNDTRRMDETGDTIDVARGLGLTTAESQQAQSNLQTKIDQTFHPSEKTRFESHVQSYTTDNTHPTTTTTNNNNTSIPEETAISSHQERALRRRATNSTRQSARTNALQTKRLQAASDAATASLLETQSSGFVEAENDKERTYRLTQQTLKRELDVNTSRHIYDLKLGDNGYRMCYDRSGRYSLLTSSRGHVAMMDNHTLTLQTELHLNDQIRDATFLHSSNLFAVAQEKCVYIYDGDGVEIHRLADHSDPYRLAFLPYHWLLASVGRNGYLKYHDTSTGEFVSSHRTKLGPCSVLRQSPSNAILHLGHSNGTVTLFSPATPDPVVKMLCHRGPVQSMAISPDGRYMATGGSDAQVKIWDLRMFKELHRSYGTVNRRPATSLDISATGVLGMAHGNLTTFRKDCFLRAPALTDTEDNETQVNEYVPHPQAYMSHSTPGRTISTLRFRPFEDVCGLGTSGGISSIVIPGSGAAQLDSTEAGCNPYADTRMKGESEIRSLLDKLPPHMIQLDPGAVGSITRNVEMMAEAKREVMEEVNDRKNAERNQKRREKRRMRGKNKVGKQLKRKANNVIDGNLVKLREKKRELEERAKHGGDEGGLTESERVKAEAPAALQRFF